MYLWVRKDGRRSKALEKGKRPKGSGLIVKVDCNGANEARRLYGLALAAAELGIDGIAELAKTDPAYAGELLAAKGKVEIIEEVQ